MNNLRTTLLCDCGNSNAVSAMEAGTLINCPCGKSITVPSLSKLRQLAGQDAFVTNPADAIRKIQRDGGNPAGDRCVLCGSDSPQFYECHALCESPQLKHAQDAEASDIPRQMLGVANYILLGPILWLLAAFAFARRPADSGNEVVGHEVQVAFTLPICNACAASSGDVTRPTVAKRLMELVPIY
jgi:hypothetical protein